MKKILALLLCAIMTLSLCACGSKGEDNRTNNDTQNTPVATEAPDITLTFVNGSTVLGTLTAKAGQLVTGYEQFETQEGYVFEGWFKTPTMLASSACDFSTAVFNENKKIFGAFRSLAKSADTRSWYIVGEGSSKVLRTSSWAGSSVEESDRKLCQLNATGNAVNEFAITLDLYAGDMFQLIYDWQWDGQKGFGTFTDIDASMFESSGSLSGESSKANVKVLMDGNYTVTITTDPDNDKYDEIKVVRNGDAAPAEVIEKAPFVVTETTQIVMKGSWVADWSENIELTRIKGTDTFTATKELAAGTELYFMVWDNGADTGIGMNSSAVTDASSQALLKEGAYNVQVSEAGTYTFTVDADSLTIVITK